MATNNLDLKGMWQYEYMYVHCASALLPCLILRMNDNFTKSMVYYIQQVFSHFTVKVISNLKVELLGSVNSKESQCPNVGIS